jgi:streptogramin lyase
MARQRPRSEVVVAVGLMAFIAIALLKPWGSPPRPAEVQPTATIAAVVAPTRLATSGPTPRPIGDEALAAALTSVPVGVAPVGLVEADGDLWFGADGGHLVRIETATLTMSDIALDPKRFSGKVGLAGDGVSLWVTGAADHSVGLLDPSNSEVSRIPAITTEPMVIDKIDGAATDGGRLWFFADVHASQDILGTPCCNGFTSTMLYRADRESHTMTQIRQLKDPLAIGVGFGSVWVLARPDGSDAPAVIDRLDVDPLDPAGTVDTTVALPAVGSGFTPCGACITSFLVGSNSIWVPTGLGKSLLRLDPAAGRVVATIDLGRDVESVAETPDGYIWVAGGHAPGAGCDPAAGYLAVIDPSTNRVVRSGHIACPVSLIVNDRAVWVGSDGPTGSSFVLFDPTR